MKRLLAALAAGLLLSGAAADAQQQGPLEMVQVTGVLCKQRPDSKFSIPRQCTGAGVCECPAGTGAVEVPLCFYDGQAAMAPRGYALKTTEMDRVLPCEQLRGKARRAHELGGVKTPPQQQAEAAPAPTRGAPSRGARLPKLPKLPKLPHPGAPAAPALARQAQAQAPDSSAPASLPSATAPLPNLGVKPKLFHVWATPDGESHFEELSISDKAGPVPLVSMSARSYNPTNVGWHNAPTPQFAINLTGVLEVEVSDHSRHRIGPGDLVLIEDVAGKGHVTRLVSPVTCLFIVVQPGFDVRRWAAGELATADR